MEAGLIAGYIILKVLASEPSHNSTYPPVTPFLALTVTFQINCLHCPFFILHLLEDTSQFPSFHLKKWSQSTNIPVPRPTWCSCPFSQWPSNIWYHWLLSFSDSGDTDLWVLKFLPYLLLLTHSLSLTFKGQHLGFSAGFLRRLSAGIMTLLFTYYWLLNLYPFSKLQTYIPITYLTSSFLFFIDTSNLTFQNRTLISHTCTSYYI